MIVELPLGYNVYGKRFRERKEYAIRLRDYVGFHVREVSSDEAPVAAEINDGSRSERLSHFDGKWWMEDRGSGEGSGAFRTSLLLADERMASRLDGGSLFVARLSQYASEYDAMVSRVAVTQESERVREVSRDFRADALHLMEKKVAEELLFIDGILHVSVPEPFMILTLADDGFATSRVHMGLPDHLKRDNRTFVFPMDKGAEFEGAVLDYESATERPVDRFNEVIHHGGAATAIQTEGMDLFHAAEAALTLGRYKMPEWPVADAVAWFGLRDAFQEARPTRERPEFPDDEMLDGLAVKVKELCSLQPMPYFLSAAADRWSYRSIEMEAEAGPVRGI